MAKFTLVRPSRISSGGRPGSMRDAEHEMAVTPVRMIEGISGTHRVARGATKVRAVRSFDRGPANGVMAGNSLQ